MAKSKRKQFRDDIKEPDQFQNFWDSVGSWFDEHRQKILIGLSLIILLIIGITYKNSLEKKYSVAAMDAFVELQSKIKAIEGSEEKIVKINAFIKEYKDAPVTAMAYLYLGVENLSANMQEEAKKAFETAREKLPVSQKAFAIEALANLASQNNKIEEAQTLYKELLDGDSQTLKDYYAWNLIVLYKQGGQVKELNKLCDSFTAQYSESQFAEKVKIYCAQ